jgi:DNA-binding transcriptional ArsR family regulator
MARTSGVNLTPNPPTHDDACGAHEHPPRVPVDLGASDEDFERAAAIFRAAGDVARLRLLARLAAGEWCVSELAEAADAGLSTVSQQLRLLRAEKLVTRRRAGKHIFYSLADEHVLDLVRSALSHAAEPHPRKAT